MKHYLKALKQKNSLLFSVGIVMLLVEYHSPPVKFHTIYNDI